LKVNGEAIYGTRTWNNPAEVKKAAAAAAGEKKEKSAAEAASTRSARTVFYTRKGNDLYVLTTEWPKQGLSVAGLKGGSGVKVSLLGTSKPVAIENRKDGLYLKPPVLTPTELPSRYAYVFRVEGLGPLK
jgi:alpha-L-fucosidase